MIPNNNPVFKKLEISAFIFGLLLIISLLSYSLLVNELLMWRSIALSVGTSLTVFLFYSSIRGIRAGDVVMVPILKEIETPFMEESYMDTVPAIAMEEGRKNNIIEVRLVDGTRGLVKLLHYGILSFPEGRLMEIEKPMKNTQSI